MLSCHYSSAMDEKRYPSHTLDKFQLRFPEGMRDQIKEAADANGRSMNAEIVHRLRQSLGIDQSPSEGFTPVKDEVADLASKADQMGSQADAITHTMDKLHSIIHGLQVTLKELEVEREYHRRQQTNHEDLVNRKYHERTEQGD